MKPAKIKWALLGGGADSLIGIAHRIAAGMGDDYQLIGGVFNSDPARALQFARDLGLGRDDLARALDTFAGEERRVDLGRVGERRFLNNVSLGAYASLVRRRERHRRRREALAGLRALWLGRHRGVWAEVDGEPVRARVLLVANNAYSIDFPTIGARDRLDEGKLHLYLPGDERSAERFVVSAAAGRLDAAIDGEPEVLQTPIEFRIEPRALRVLVPDGGG